MVVLVLAAIATAAAHQAFTRYISIDTARARLAALDVASAKADVALMEVAASERGYVAPGQGLDFWTTRVDEALAEADAALIRMQSTAASPAAIEQLSSAMSRLDDLAVMDGRARQYARDGRASMASDLIFADGYEMIAAARTEAAAAAAAERSALSAPLARDARIHMASLAALAGCLLLSLMLLLRAPKAEQPSVTALEPLPVMAQVPASAVADDSIGAALDASLEGLDQLPAFPAAPASLAAPASPASSAVNLSQAADVCVDLARLLDARDLQAVLARIAGVLEADGLIVWMTDAPGQTLAPAVTHGYAPALVARLGALHVDADNATADAWRSKTMQVIGANGTHPGALAVPLLTSSGCAGVLAVELKDGKERASDVQSLARIVAAQLASSIAPAPAESARAAEA